MPVDLARQARALLHDTQAAQAEENELREAIAAETERLAQQAWHITCTNPVMQAFLDSTAPQLTDDIARRLADGQTWSSKQLRKRAAYLWRVIGRAAAKTTPRDWAGQTALIPITNHPTTHRPTLLAPGTPLGDLAAIAVENVHLARARTTPTDLHTATPDTLLAPTPLHFTEPPTTPHHTPGHIRCYVIDPTDNSRLRQILLRRTPLLESVLTLLADGPRPLHELEQHLAPPTPPPHQPPPPPEVLRGFLQHLHRLGVLQICRPPRHHVTTWTPTTTITTASPQAPASEGPGAPPEAPASDGTGTPPQTPANDSAGAPQTPADDGTSTPPQPPARSRTRTLPRAPADGGPGAWFLDAYRRLGPGACVPQAAVARVQHGLRIAARIAALRETDQLTDPPPQHPALAALTEQPRPIGEILAAHLNTDDPPPAPRRYTGWSPARDPAGGYARLLNHLDTAARHGTPCVDLDDTLLDTFGAPPANDALPPWPIDCLLRPLPPPATGTGPLAVLETASAAAVLDARFADALHTLHGSYPNTDAYRAFLTTVETHTAVRFVDLLVPPLTEHAANAVRRPVTTRWWTGDPDPTPYYGTPHPPARHLPLNRITLRRSQNQIVAEADGHRIIPVYHATRSPAPPYDTLLRLLLAASHPAASYLLRLDTLDTALPHHTRLPRLTAGNALVLAPATWHIDRTRLWHPRDDPLTKIRTLALLRRTNHLPAHTFARTAPATKPIPLDLTSLSAIPHIERLCAQHTTPTLQLEEMLPAPGQHLLHDPLHHNATLATQLLLRLPHQPPTTAPPPHNVPGPAHPADHRDEPHPTKPKRRNP
ncbi:lantibiotic dehydratase [Streptomyces reticuli]|uniref:lantibiotic dehydratase n=1 Tax=Streptomyces reticuli TaxID=1926 RepID=UPI00074341B1